MAFWNKKGPETNLSLFQEGKKAESSEAKVEAPKRSGAERVAEGRKSVLEGFKNVFKKTVDIGKKFVGGFDRVAGKGLEGAEAAGRGIKKGAEAVGSTAVKGAAKFGEAAQFVGEMPDWLMDKAGEGLNVAQKKGAAALKATGRGIKTTAEIGVGLGVAAAVGTYEAGKKGVEKLGDLKDSAERAIYRGSMEAVNWMDRKATDGKEFVGKNYESLKGWAGEKATKIQERATAAKESFKSGVETVKGWKNQAMEAYHTNRFEAHFAKLSPEAQATSLERLKAIQGGQNLKQELMAA